MVNLWSKSTPGLQLVWDATSLRALMECPRKYQLGFVEAWRAPGGTDVTFGGLFASALEAGWKARAAGASYEEAQFVAVKWALLNSGERVTVTDGNDVIDPAYPNGIWVPWGGSYQTVWHCLGDVKGFKNAKGNAAKCPYSHKGKWFEGTAPASCGRCGGTTETSRRWFPLSPTKNRNSLIRCVVWYWEEMIERGRGGNTIDVIDPKLMNNIPAVEIPFVIPSGYWTTGPTVARDQFLICGRLDGVKNWGGTDENYITDNKTTGKALNDAYWRGYSPDVQVDIYDLAGSIILPQLKLSGVMIEAAQVGAEFARFGVRTFRRSEREREEFHKELGYWLARAEEYATKAHWPRNRSSCRMCNFNELCLKDDATRNEMLQAKFIKHPWNPLRDIGLDGEDKDNGIRVEQHEQRTSNPAVKAYPGEDGKGLVPGGKEA
jgi:hypothetical protein